MVKRLPKTIQTILIVSEDILEKLALMADKMMDTKKLIITHQLRKYNKNQKRKSAVS